MSLSELRTRRCIAEGLMAQEQVLLPPPHEDIITHTPNMHSRAFRIESELVRIAEELEQFKPARLSSLEQQIRSIIQ